MGTIRGAWDRLLPHWEAGLRRRPWFTQRTAVVLLGVLVATRRRRSGIDVALAWPVAPAGPPHARRAYPTGVSAMLGGVVALVGWPGAGGPARLVPVSGPVRLRRPARSLAGPLTGDQVGGPVRPRPADQRDHASEHGQGRDQHADQQHGRPLGEHRQPQQRGPPGQPPPPPLPADHTQAPNTP